MVRRPPSTPAQVLIIDPAGVCVRLLVVTPGGPDFWGPAWSPDGRAICHASRCRDCSRLVVTPVDGSPSYWLTAPGAADDDTPSWSPDGRYLAYAQADEVGIVSVKDKVPLPLASFVPYRTRSHWAWVPSVSWSSDGYLVSFVAHEGDLEGLSPEDSPIFGLWAASVDGKVQVRLKEEVGMWSGPRWAPAGGEAGDLMAFGQAQSPRNSEDSRYELYVSDRDGSNARRLFPPQGLMGLIAPAVAWSPRGDAMLVEYEGNLYRIDVTSGSLDQLTADGQSTQPRWAP